MGYSKNIASILKMEATLELLKQGKPCSWDVPGTDYNRADRFAFRIRQALWVARRNPEQFPELAAAAGRFKIQVVNDGLVQAVHTEGTTEAVAQLLGGVSQGQPVAGPAAAHVRAAIQTPEEVVAAWHAAQPTNDKIHFPEAALDSAAMQQVAAWAAQLTPPWMLLHSKGTNALTLAPHDTRVPKEARVQP